MSCPSSTRAQTNTKIDHESPLHPDPGVLANLGHTIGRTTIADILKRHGVEPAPPAEIKNNLKKSFSVVIGVNSRGKARVNSQPSQLLLLSRSRMIADSDTTNAHHASNGKGDSVENLYKLLELGETVDVTGDGLVLGTFYRVEILYEIAGERKTREAF